MHGAMRGNRATDTGDVTMRVKIARTYKEMPEGAKIGDEVDMDDDEFAEQRRLGNVERLGPQAQGNKANQSQQQAGQDRPQANQAQQDKSPTAVDPVSTDTLRGQNQDRSNK